MYSKKKWILITTVMITMLLGMTGCGKSTDDTAQAENSVVTAEDLPVPETLNDDEEPKADDAQNTGQGTEDDAQETPAEEENKPHYINEGKELYGDIWEVGEGRFTVTEIHTEESEDGGQEMTILAEDAATEAPKITIMYDGKTKFIKQNIWDGGARHEEKETTAADLKKGLTAQMDGSYEGDVFHATEIMIVEVFLD